jgi:hypothetical protein
MSDVDQINRPRQGGISHKSITDWLCQLAADRDGPALIVAKAIGGLMATKPRERVALAHLCHLTGLPSATINTIVYRMRNPGSKRKPVW